MRFWAAGLLLLGATAQATAQTYPTRSITMIVPLAAGATADILARTASVKDVIAQAKAKPGELTYSSGGNGTSHHISGVLFQQMIDTPLTHVPYRATPAGIAAVMQGEVAIGFFNTPTVIAQIKDGKLKPLGVTSLQRSPHLPQLPTLDEAGVKGYEMITWLGFAAPAGTPAAIVERWHSEIVKVIRE